MNSKITQAAIDVHKKYRDRTKKDVSTQTKSAIQITREWQEIICDGKIIKQEVSVSPEGNEKIDVVDLESMVAYEMKVSGKNAHHEFYKDIVKVLTYNLHREQKSDHIKKMVFLSEEYGIISLEKRLDAKFVSLLEDVHNMAIELIPIK